MRYVKGRGTLKMTGYVHEFLWKDGELSGNAVALAALESKDADMTGQHIGVVMGPHTLQNHLKDPWSTKHLAMMVFEDDLVLEDNLPTEPLEYDPNVLY